MHQITLDSVAKCFSIVLQNNNGGDGCWLATSSLTSCCSLSTALVTTSAKIEKLRETKQIALNTHSANELFSYNSHHHHQKAA